MHFRAAAASTPSGAPPVPIYMSIPVWAGSAQCITPATSPSVMSRIAAPMIGGVFAVWLSALLILPAMGVISEVIAVFARALERYAATGKRAVGREVTRGLRPETLELLGPWESPSVAAADADMRATDSDVNTASAGRKW